VAAQRSGKAATEYLSYLRTAEVADILYVSPKTVSRWAKEGKLPFLRTLGGHRRYSEAEIRELAKELREEARPERPVLPPTRAGGASSETR
jgi:excisionase family DNA binding protein